MKTTICLAEIPIEIESYTGSIPETFRMFETDREPVFSVAAVGVIPFPFQQHC